MARWSPLGVLDLNCFSSAVLNEIEPIEQINVIQSALCIVVAVLVFLLLLLLLCHRAFSHAYGVSVYGDQDEVTFIADGNNHSDQSARNSAFYPAPPIAVFVLARSLVDRSTLQRLDYLPHCEISNVKFHLEVSVPSETSFCGQLPN